MTRQHIAILQLLLLLAGTPFIGAGTALVDTAPAFTNPATAGFSVAASGSFTVSAGGAPAPVLAIVSGAMPPGLGFSDNNDGTVTDGVTGLMWDKCTWGKTNNTDCSGGAATTHTWAQALAATANGGTIRMQELS